MWSEDFDKKIRDSAGDDNAAYDEKSWDKMQHLLDQHLPEGKRKRRIIFWFTLPLLIAIPTILYLQNDNRKNSGPSAISQQKDNPAPVNNAKTEDNSGMNKRDHTVGNTDQPVNTAASAQKQPATVSLPAIDARLNPSSPAKTAHQSATPDEINQARQTGIAVTKASVSRKPKPVSNPTPTDPFTSNSYSENKDVTATNTPADPANADSKPLPVAPVTGKPRETMQANADVAKSDDKEKATVDQKEPEKKAAASTQTQKPGTKHGGKLGINLSAGPDISSVGFHDAGKTTVQYGLGLSYDLSKHFTVRAGFLASKKIYSAAPADYKAPPNFWAYYPNMENIEANCLVYEIPVTVVYNFGEVKKHNWFVSTGLSSYLMKRETYDYYYKNVWGQPDTRNRTIESENSNIFSIINISGGYRYRFNDRFSLTAEPYVKIPMSGVGEGQVKLNSAGILFTVGYKPFQKRN